MDELKQLSIVQKLQKIQLELKAPKKQRNKFGNYNYRSAEDILEAIKPMSEKYGVVFKITEELGSLSDGSTLKHISHMDETTNVPTSNVLIENGVDFIKSTAKCICVKSLNEIESDAYAIIDYQAKGMQMPQRTGAASSYAKKYALGNLLLLDDTKDADATNTHGKDKGYSADYDNNALDKDHPKYNAVKKYLEDGGDAKKVTEKYLIKDKYLLDLVDNYFSKLNSK